MIVSDDHKFVFVEVPRTGTSSIANELMGNYGCRRIRPRHATLDEVYESDPSVRDYRVFAGKRHPLDSAVSFYFKLKNNHLGWYTDESKWAVNGGWIEPHVLEQFEFVNEHDADFAQYFRRYHRSVQWLPWRHDLRRAEYVVAFEDLDNGFAEMLRILGLNQVAELPHANQTGNRDRDYSVHYTPDIRGQAVGVFGPMIRDLSYEFPESWGVVHPSRLASATYRLEGLRVAPSTPAPVARVFRRPSGVARRAVVKLGSSG